MRLLAISCLTLLAIPLEAQQERASGTYVVQRGGGEIGREQFTLEPGADDRSGSTLTISSQYKGSPRGGAVAARLARTADGQLARFQLDVDGVDGKTVILAAGAGARVILKTIAKGTEAGRELPGGQNVVLLDDSAYSLFIAVAQLATPAGARLTAIYPRTSRRAEFVARRQSDAGGSARITLSGEISGTLTLGSAGYPTRMEFPATGTTVVLSER